MVVLHAVVRLQMVKKLLFRQIKNIQEVLSRQYSRRTLALMALFMLVNALKVSLVNLQMITERTPEIFLYKFGFTLLLVLMIYPFVFMLKPRLPVFVFYWGQILYLGVNLSYYQYFHKYLHFRGALSVFREGMTATLNSSAPLSLWHLVLLLDLPLFVLLVKKVRWPAPVVRRIWVVALLSAVLCVVTLGRVEARNFSQKVSFVQNVKNYYEGEQEIVERYGTLFNAFLNLYENRDVSHLIRNFTYGPLIHGSAAGEEKLNVVLVQVESLDAAVPGLMHNGQPVAPFLQELAGSSVYYSHTLSYHLGGSTSDAEFSVLNSIHPLVDYPSIKLDTYTYPNSMVKQFDRAGYRTVGYHGNVGGFFNRNLAYPKMGFQEFMDIDSMGLTEAGWGASDQDVFSYALKHLETLEEPFFAQIVTMTSHGPFTNAEHYYRNLAYEDVENERVRNYLNSVSYVDRALAMLVEELRSRFPDTLIVIYGDHTPSIREEEFSQTSFKEEEKYFEFVPLFILTPEGQIHREDRLAASFLDVAPTVLKASGIGYSIRTDGEDLLQPGRLSNPVPFRGTWFSRQGLVQDLLDRPESPEQ